MASNNFGIVYALVANGKIILADTEKPAGNVKVLVKQILSKLPEGDVEARMSYTHDSHVLHILTEQGLVFLCVADESYGRRKSFAYLEDMKNRFITSYGSRALSCKKKRKFDSAFGPILQKQMDWYSTNPEADKMLQIKREMDNVKQVMGKNVEIALQRGEKLTDLITMTQELQMKAEEFKDGANALKWAFFWKNVMMYLLIFGTIGGIGYFLAAKACGGYKLPNCRSTDEDEPAAPKEAAKKEEKTV